MIMDTNTQFATALSGAQEAGTALFGDVIDTTVARDMGNGQTVYLVIQVTTTFDGGAATNGTTQFILASDSVEAIAADGSETRHWASDVYLGTQLTAGFTMVVPLPMGSTISSTGYERYMGIELIQAVEGEDDGAFSAFLTLDPHGWTSYPDATN